VIIVLEKIKAFFKWPRPEAGGAEKKAAGPPETKVAEAPEKKVVMKAKGGENDTINS